MHKFIIAIAAAMAALTLGSAAIAADPVYVMRHLQKAEGADPPLSSAGAANAQALARLLGGQNVKAIFATPTRRAQQTGEALARQLAISITTYDPADPARLVDALSKVNGAALVIGHSNTVPDIVASLGGARPEALGDQDFGTIYVVRRGSASVCQIALAAPAPCVDGAHAAK
jgi:phosphohistidine phosphatase SixA